MHLVIATREDPPLSLARLRVRGQLTELRATDLCFTSSEAAEFLSKVMGLDLSAEDISALESRTEGWIAGLQLAAISMQGDKDITRFIARESRSYVVSVSGLMHADWITNDVPHADRIRAGISAESDGWLTDGGSCVAGPDGQWVLQPQVGGEGLFFADLSIEQVARERQNFDPAGHYSRPDVTRLKVNRRRQKTVTLKD